MQEFSKFLGEYQGGILDDTLGKELAKLTEAVSKQGKKGTMSLNIILKPILRHVSQEQKKSEPFLTIMVKITHAGVNIRRSLQSRFHGAGKFGSRRIINGCLKNNLLTS